MEIELFSRKIKIPELSVNIIKTLNNNGYEAYLVGGCVRDLLIKREPKDWDITTNAKPEEIIRLFPRTFYENSFGTVGVVDENNEKEIVEVTPFRIEGAYDDYRHPNDVKFSDRLEDDLGRRDFTINSLALAIKDNRGEITDLYNGRKDLLDKTIRTVGKAEDRFKEDALRMLRAIRISSELGFTLNIDTKKAIISHSELISKISMERIRDEFTKIIMSPRPMEGIILSHETGILKHFIPELEAGIDITQKGSHIYTVWEHLLRSLQHAADKNYGLEIRLSALFHDISKPETRRFSRETGQYTFFGHEVVGSRVTKKILERMKFPVKTIEKVAKLVRWHMFFSDPEQITLSAVRRMVANVGSDNIWDLMYVRICDRIGTGRPKEEPYRFRKYQSMIEEALRAPVTVGMLKIDGNRIMEVTRETPGPKVGFILNALMEEVLEKPELNTSEYLESRSIELNKLELNELKELADKGKTKKQEKEEEEINKIRDKFKVK
jgi:poly(A) polymerase/tRNA nucleotidyltransferase (CCA-adding enzyme)